MGGQVVVTGSQGRVPGLGDDPFARRTTPPATGGGRDRVVFGDGAVFGEGFEVPADPGGRQPEQAAQRGGGHRAPLGHRSEDSRTGARLLLGMPFGRLDNHNVSMS